MIQQNDLRIGNLIDDGYGNPLPVTSINGIMVCSNNWGFEFKDAKPIALTDEWLIKFGFKHNPTCEHYEYYEVPSDLNENSACHHALIDYETSWMYLKTSGHFREEMDIVLRNIKYVHQLQNLFFCLIGHELELLK